MNFKPDTFDAWSGMLQSFKESGYLWGLPGKALGGGRYQLNATEPGKVYVRILNQSDQVVSLTTAVNLGANLDPAIKVRMEYIKGQLTIINPDPRDAATAYGDKVSQAAVPPHSGAIGGGNDDYIESERFTPGLVTASPVGGLFVRIYAFRYGNRDVPTQDYEIDAANVPTNALETRLSAIVYNPLTDGFEVVNGATSFTGTTYYTPDDLDAVHIPTNRIPLGAVTLYEGMTTLLAAQVRVFDLREFLNFTSPYPDFGEGELVTISGGVLDVSAATSRNIIVAAESGTADDVDQVIGVLDGQEVIFQADTGDTITFKHSTDIIFYGMADVDVTGDDLLKLVGRGADVVSNYVDLSGLLTLDDGLISVASVTLINLGSGLTLTDNGGGSVDLDAPGGGGGGGALELIILHDEKTANISGGTSGGASWAQRDLNVEVTDTGGNCSVSSNQFTLNAGTYRIDVHAPAFAVGRHRIRLYNVTDAAVQQDTGGRNIVGTSSYANTVVSGISGQTNSFITGRRFTIAGSKTFRIEHWTDAVISTRGFGVESNDGEVELYTVVRLEKE